MNVNKARNHVGPYSALRNLDGVASKVPTRPAKNAKSIGIVCLVKDDTYLWPMISMCLKIKDKEETHD